MEMIVPKHVARHLDRKYNKEKDVHEIFALKPQFLGKLEPSSSCGNNSKGLFK